MIFINFLRQAFPPPPTWSAEDIPDLSGKVVLVTGGNTGIGREIVEALLRKNAKVYLAARSRDRASEAIEALKKKTGNTGEYLQLDLSDLTCVQEAVLEFSRRETHIDILFLNAGLLCPPPDRLTAQNYDLTFGTNVIGHFLFFRLLYPLLTSPSRLAGADPSRVIWLSSFASYVAPGGRLQYSTFTDGTDRRAAGMFAMYAQSKLAQNMLSTYLAKSAAERGDNIVSIAVDPGNVESEIFREVDRWYMRIWHRFIMYPVSYGAITPLYAGTAPEAIAHNGKYLHAWARLGTPHPTSLDVEEQQKLWSWLEAQTKDYM